VVSPASFHISRAVAMTHTHLVREMLSRLRAISNNCTDSWAVARLRIMVDEVEQRLADQLPDDCEHGVSPMISEDDAA
jgi:hypothetical protein